MMFAKLLLMAASLATSVEAVGYCRSDWYTGADVWSVCHGVCYDLGGSCAVQGTTVGHTCYLASSLYLDDYQNYATNLNARCGSLGFYLDGCQYRCGSAPFTYEDVALNKPATESTTYPGTSPSWGNDGDFDTQQHTFGSGGGEKNPWFMVDLGGEFLVQKLRIWNRPDACGSRLFATGSVCNGDANGYVSGTFSASNQGAKFGVSNQPCSGDSCPGVIWCPKLITSQTGAVNPNQMYDSDCGGVSGRYAIVMLPGDLRMLHVTEFQALVKVTQQPTSAPTTSAPTGAPTHSSIVAKLETGGLQAGLGYVFGYTGDNAYMCSSSGGTTLCLKSAADSRNSWAIMAADSAEVLDATDEATGVTMSDGAWEVTPGGPTFTPSDGSPELYFAAQCDCA